jgi:diadenosine tetraphosphate (Ap4A) HIT family hydrolase
MATHQDDCDVCRRLEECRSGTHSGLIAELETGYAVMGDSQYFRGYCLLLCKTAATELDELPYEVRGMYLEEMADLAEAVRAALRPHKLNYECLGNQVHHLHWHIFPRYLSEPAPDKPVWLCMPSGDAARWAFEPARDGEMLKSIRSELARVRSRRRVQSRRGDR